MGRVRRNRRLHHRKAQGRRGRQGQAPGEQYQSRLDDPTPNGTVKSLPKCSDSWSNTVHICFPGGRGAERGCEGNEGRVRADAADAPLPQLPRLDARGAELQDEPPHPRDLRMPGGEDADQGQAPPQVG